jgi:hypothetical protein
MEKAIQIPDASRTRREADPHKTAGSPLRYDKPQGILAKANKVTNAF